MSIRARGIEIAREEKMIGKKDRSKNKRYDAFWRIVGGGERESEMSV